MNTRYSSNLHVPYTRLSKVQKGVLYLGSTFFNRLPEQIKMLSGDPKLFKAKLKKFLLDHTLYNLHEFAQLSYEWLYFLYLIFYKLDMQVVSYCYCYSCMINICSYTFFDHILFHFYIFSYYCIIWLIISVRLDGRPNKWNEMKYLRTQTRCVYFTQAQQTKCLKNNDYLQTYCLRNNLQFGLVAFFSSVSVVSILSTYRTLYNVQMQFTVLTFRVYNTKRRKWQMD